MADSIEEYLASDQAAEDVGLALCERTVKATCKPRGLDAWWHTRSRGGWRCIRLDLCHYADSGDLETRRAVRVYFRPEGDRRIVTDMGEAVRALRLLRGCSATAAAEATRPIREAANVAAWAGETGLWIEMWIEMYEGSLAVEMGDRGGVLVADLPRAICALMLAAYRVSRLEVPRG